MNRKGVTAAQLLRELALDWRRDAAEDLFELWTTHLHISAEILDADSVSLTFLSSLRDIHFRGTDDVPCILVGGEQSDAGPALREFQRVVADPAQLFFVLAVSDAAAREARSLFAGSRYVLLGTGQLASLLAAAAPIEALRSAIRASIPIRSLNPYNILLTPQANMFFGRGPELERLRDEDDVSFAIAGPSRIGKSSLVHQYRRELRKFAPGRYRSSFYLDLMECTDKSPGALAHFLAMRLEGSRLSSKVGLDEFPNFLRRMRSRLGVRVELVLDEVDSSVESAFFQTLGEAARNNLCRLVLCGRGGLLKAALRSSQRYGCRLDLMRLEPLDVEAARALVLRPLRDLGFELQDETSITGQLFELTGRLPYLLQFCLRRLVEVCIVGGAKLLTPEHVRELRWDYDTAQYFTSPLSDLTDPECRLVALVLLELSPDQVDQSTVQQIAASAGLRLDQERCKEICNDLFINNILAWRGGSFRMANKALAHFTRESGYLASAIQEARSRAGVAARTGEGR